MSDDRDRESKYRAALQSNYCGCLACEAQLAAVMAVTDAEQAELRAEVHTYHDRAMASEAAEAGWQDRAQAAEAKVARVEALPAEWLGSVGVLNAIFETLSEHATVTQSDGPHGPYVWCGCGWRSDEQPGCDPGPASVIHVSNAVHAAVTPAIREGLTVRVRAALAGDA